MQRSFPHIKQSDSMECGATCLRMIAKYYGKEILLFFDEATNSLDANNERVIVNNLTDFYKGKTVIIVAHRLSTVRNADQIIVLDKGCIQEIGTHEELIIRRESYYNIRDITYHNVEMQGVNADSRRAVFDIFCEGADGELFIVEMQKKRQLYFADRVLYYASFAIQMQADIEREKFKRATPEELKRWNYHINQVYVVCFLNYEMDKSRPDKYRWDVVRMDRELRVPFNETLNEIYLELPKFRLELSECDTIYKKFLYALNNIDIMNNLPKEMDDQLFRKLKSAIELQRMSAKERLAYEMSIAAERDLSACMEASYEEGVEKGIEKGIEKGKAEGLLAGMRQVASHMKRKGMDITSIMDCTGLSADVILAL